MIITIAHNSYLLLIGSPPSRTDFMQRARVKQGTYAEELVGDIFDEIFHLSVELRRQYRLYYQLEYTSFSLFAQRIGHIPSSLCGQMDEYYRQYAHIIRYIPSQMFLEDDDGAKLLGRLLDTKIRHQ